MVLDLMSPDGVVDELGIGVIRDAFAERLFPGISTIQTRAKYFITIPRIIKDYEQLTDRQRRHQHLTNFLATQETQCRIRLVQKYGKSESLGIIGVTFGTWEDREVLRQPSSVYWNGLRAYGIVKTDLSLAEFCQKYSGHRSALRTLLQDSRVGRRPARRRHGGARSIRSILPYNEWLADQIERSRNDENDPSISAWCGRFLPARCTQVKGIRNDRAKDGVVA